MICDEAEQIDIRKLHKQIRPLPEVFHYQGERFVTTWTQTEFGGRRQWFLCPSCERRCAILYLKGGGPLWGCRVCMGGRYESEHKSPKGRKLHKAFKIREKFGQLKGGIGVPFPPKPKGMHWKTYQRIRDEAKQREREILIEDLARLKGMTVAEIIEELRRTKGVLTHS